MSFTGPDHQSFVPQLFTGAKADSVGPKYCVIKGRIPKAEALEFKIKCVHVRG